MVEKECSIKSGDAVLKGTACLPKIHGRFPVVLMIHGSGPLDRDENIDGQGLNIFNAIAHHLADNGIASVRYDKRGCGESTGNYYSAGHFDLVEDAVQWFDSLDGFEFCDQKRKYLLGHSEGCIIAPQVNLKRPAVAGMILLAPFIESLETILRAQAKVAQTEIERSKGFSGAIKRTYCKIFGQPIEAQNNLITKIKNTSSDYFYAGFRKIEAKWIRELFTVNAIEIFEQVTSPILAIAGEKDLQCNPQDVEKFQYSLTSQ